VTRSLAAVVRRGVDVAHVARAARPTGLWSRSSSRNEPALDADGSRRNWRSTRRGGDGLVGRHPRPRPRLGLLPPRARDAARGGGGSAPWPPPARPSSKRQRSVDRGVRRALRAMGQRPSWSSSAAATTVLQPRGGPGASRERRRPMTAPRARRSPSARSCAPSRLGALAAAGGDGTAPPGGVGLDAVADTSGGGRVHRHVTSPRGSVARDRRGARPGGGRRRGRRRLGGARRWGATRGVGDPWRPAAGPSPRGRRPRRW